MNIKNVRIDGFCALAPMAGAADAVFRKLCRNFGASYTVSEMVSAKAICMNSEKTKELMLLDSGEHPAAIQLFGSEPEIMAEAARRCLEYSPDVIDINMGCPAPKIVKNGAGGALMDKPELAEKTVRAVADAVDIPVTAKIRTGTSSGNVNCVSFAQRLENAGAAAVTIHGRTRQQMYAPPVDFDSLRRVKAALSIPVICNGDIFTPEQAKHMYEYTGCDFIMVGRGSLGRPWIFSQISQYLSSGYYSPDPDAEEKMQIMLAHAREICELYGKKKGMLEIRKHALWYTKGIKGSAKLRSEFSIVSSVEELELLAKKAVQKAEQP